MLELLESSLGSFKAVRFEPGVNIAVAIRTKQARDTASRNAVGKSSLIAIVDFLLASDANRNHLMRRPELADEDFRLDLSARSGHLTLSRSGADQSNPRLNGLPIPLAEAREVLRDALFDVRADVNTPSFRALIALYLRNREAGGFQNPLRFYSRQADLAVYPALTHLLSLDEGVTSRALEIAESSKQVSALRKAAKDPIFGLAAGNVEDLDAQIATLEISIAQARDNIAGFRVVDRYEESRRVADTLSLTIRTLNDEAAILVERSRELREALDSHDGEQPDRSYLEGVFQQVGILMPESVVRRFAEVREFHESVARNRREHVAHELGRSEERLVTVRSEIAARDLERSALMSVLEAGGALETFTELQSEIAVLEGKREALVERRKSASALKSAASFVKAQGVELEDFTRRDLLDRDEQVSTMRTLFASLAYEIYGSERPAALSVVATPGGYRFTPTLGGERSAGVSSMAIFCFDLTVAVLAHRAGRGPDFLIHDSHLFDSVEERQVGLALSLADRVCRSEQMQYIVTMNSDALEAALQYAPGLEYNTAVELTDEYETGGLFGLRFN
jgi:uncharacterized protein YydD (DUF2326 family)